MAAAGRVDPGPGLRGFGDAHLHIIARERPAPYGIFSVYDRAVRARRGVVYGSDASTDPAVVTR